MWRTDDVSAWRRGKVGETRTVVLADDDTLLREGIASLLQRSGFQVVGQAHDAPGLLWRVGRALGECGLNVRAARVETLGAEVVDVFYVTGQDGEPLTDRDLRRSIVHSVLAVLAI